MAFWLVFAIPFWLVVGVLVWAYILAIIDHEADRQAPPYPEMVNESLGLFGLLAIFLVYASPLALAAVGFMLHLKRFRSAETP